MEKEITKLFQTRDKAVLEQDADLFRSTQLPDVEYSSVQGYLAIDNLTTEILFIHKDTANIRVVFVKETYKPKDKAAYSSYVQYYIVQTTEGWRIYKIK